MKTHSPAVALHIMWRTSVLIIWRIGCKSGAYVAYRGNAIREAIQRIQAADEVVTYNGNGRDLEDLGSLRVLPASKLLTTYEMCLGKPPAFRILTKAQTNAIAI